MALHEYETQVSRKGSAVVVLDSRANLRGVRLLLDTMTECTFKEKSDILQSLVDNGQVLVTCEKTLWVLAANRIPERYR